MTNQLRPGMPPLRLCTNCRERPKEPRMGWCMRCYLELRSPPLAEGHRRHLAALRATGEDFDSAYMRGPGKDAC